MEDLERARKRLLEATQSLANIEGLPTTAGSRVRWTHNKTVWTRVGENGWLPEGVYDTRRAAPSAHVAHKPYEVIES